jgi:hydrogenase maturation protein HypF
MFRCDPNKPHHYMRDGTLTRARLTIRGAVQGVGFRPSVFRLAKELGLAGWVNNSCQGVFVELEGSRRQVQTFILRIEKERPPRSFIQSFETSWLDPVGYRDFVIRQSDPGGAKTALVLPDIAICPECTREIFDPNNRRYLYPFTNCTNCGPRFSIIEALPYDRSQTSMRRFTMCDRCRAEYENPLDRRFHAQPNACPICGPHLELWDLKGQALSMHDKAIVDAARGIEHGLIVAVKGLGGFHLMVDARNDKAVVRLRKLKCREEKPFAVMYPSLEAVLTECTVSQLEQRLLCSAEAPIVLLRRNPSVRNDRSNIGPSIAPRNPYLGVMLPYTPLHHLLLRQLRFPVVATSGNLVDEPICTDEHEALDRLGGIADLFLVHNRPIVRHVDDSVVQLAAGREMVLRRARGYAPLPVALKYSPEPTLAVGGHLKNTVALSVGRQVFISQHIGDLESAPALNAFHRVIKDFERLYEAPPVRIAADLHPDYLSTKHAQQNGVTVVNVQHHYAHVLSCMAENELDAPVLGVSWDGTGYGLDGSIWGGEFLKINDGGFERIAHFRSFPLPGGNAAVREPRRSAVGLLYEILGDRLFSMRSELLPLLEFTEPELLTIRTMLKQRLNCPRTSSVGRLFDAVAAIVGLRQRTQFEGQAAMELEFMVDPTEAENAYEVRLNSTPGLAAVADWQPLVDGILADMKSGCPASQISIRFHNALVETIILVIRHEEQERVVLSGGCFQNRFLLERAVRRLAEEGFRPYYHQRIPPNDGGISLGQIVAAARTKT